MNLMERLDNLRSLIVMPEFLEGKGLSNEVNIRIFCYDPKDEMAVRCFTDKLVTDTSLACRIKEFNLYKVFISICDDKRITDKIAAQEEKKGKRYVLDQMKRIACNKSFVEKMEYSPRLPGDVILITNVGAVAPFICVHSLLEAMQPIFSNIPIIVMYPGSFDGTYLKLFDKLNANPYYRPFNVV